MKIVVLDGFAANPGDLSWEPLAALGQLTLYDRTAPEDVIARIGDAQAVYTNKVPITAEILDACPSIQFICVTATGYNVVDVQAARARGIPVCNIPAYSSASVTQMVFAFLLEIAHNTAHHAQAVQEGRWATCQDFCFWDTPMMELAGKTLGIIGYGSIGQKVAAIAVGFGMNVLANSRTLRPELETEHIKLVSQDAVFAGADILTLHCPQNEASRNLICEETIAKMKDSVIIINTARGGCVVEADVAHALQTGKLSWYAADVLSTEPPQADNPLLTAPHALITPHIAWATREARLRLMDIAVDNLRAFLSGSPINVVS